ncbi:hypothetical protein GEMRC1_001594 [Eukaryota sp. GEM-RC1]
MVLLLHLSLTVILLIQVVSLVTRSSHHIKATSDTLTQFLVPDADDLFEDTNKERELLLYSMNEVVDKINHTITILPELHSNCLSMFIPVITSVRISSMSFSPHNSATLWTLPSQCSLPIEVLSSSHNLSLDSPLGPLSSNSDVLCALHAAKSIDVESLITSKSIQPSIEISWKVVERFKLTRGGGTVVYNIEFYNDSSFGSNLNLQKTVLDVVIAWLICMCALLSIVLTLVFEVVLSDTASIELSYKLWLIGSCVSDLLNILSSLVILFPSFVGVTLLEPYQSFLIGSGTLLRWMLLPIYFEFSKYLYLLITALKSAFPNVCKFLFSVSPVYFAFTFFGYCYFSSGSKWLFGSIGQSAVTLFAALNGDQVADFYDEIYAVSPVISRLFFYVFISLFTYTVLNATIIIVETAFWSTSIAEAHLNPYHSFKINPYTDLECKVKEHMASDLKHNLVLLKALKS